MDASPRGRREDPGRTTRPTFVDRCPSTGVVESTGVTYPNRSPVKANFYFRSLFYRTKDLNIENTF